MLGIINILLGIGLLIAGRRLFWLFVAAAGFVAGVQFALRTWTGQEGLAIVVGVAVGILFALLAVFLRVVAISVAGFLAGGSTLLNIAAIFGVDGGAFAWVIYIVGGILGLILVSVLFDWAIITLSSLAGAALVVQAIPFQRPGIMSIAFIGLVLAGVIYQGLMLRREKAND